MDDNALAVITAAGESRRMGTGVSKQLLSLCGTAVIEHTLRAVLSAESVSGAVLVVKPGECSFFDEWYRKLTDGDKFLTVTPGGASRQESVYNGITALPRRPGVVVIHDGARPLVSPELIDRVVEHAAHSGAASLGVPVKDTVKRTGENMQVIETVSRENLWLVQTPQAFKYDVLFEAHEKANGELAQSTDDAALVERIGYPVTMVMGSYKNIKITTPEDIPLAEALLKASGENIGA